MNRIKLYFSLMVFLLFAAQVYAQESLKVDSEKATDPYVLEVTYNKTSHLIFPSAITYVDLGSEYLSAGKAEDANNVLRIKASVDGFEGETNFSVITTDGSFYSFTVYYSPYPSKLSHDLSDLQLENRRHFGGVFLEDLGSYSPFVSDYLLSAIYERDKRYIKHIASRSYGVQFSLKGLYSHEHMLYFHTELKNESNIPYSIDFINFKIVDRKVAKRTVSQEKPLKILRSYQILSDVRKHSTATNVFLLDNFTLTNDKMLIIEVYEKNGGRHQIIEVNNNDVIRAVPVDQLHLKMK